MVKLVSHDNGIVKFGERNPVGPPEFSGGMRKIVLSSTISVRYGMGKTIELHCARCGQSFSKELREYRRQISDGRKQDRFFCSLSCFGQDVDEFSPFRFVISTCKKNAKAKGLKFDLDLQYLKTLWEQQKGICPYLKRQMVLRPVSRLHDKLPEQASLDRIDSTKGYVKGNVEFICLFVNLGKNGFTKQQVLDLIARSNKSSSAPC